MDFILSVSQIVCSLCIIIYFFKNSHAQGENIDYIDKNAEKEYQKMRELRSLHLTRPLSEKARPKSFSEICGQDEPLLALRAAICSPNPQHVLLYGPPGVGKTCAARAAFLEAVSSPLSPFNKDSSFVETDASALYFDERGVADPLLGSVHDPIFQGGGAFGQCGIPKPLPGAVTKAHGGILFIDEIGEMHPYQLNRLLKVLEDRCVHFESSYYNPANTNIPKYIHDIFEKGLPADFRLIGATTRLPEQIPLAVRSRCCEIFFNPLNEINLYEIAANAVSKGGFSADTETLALAVAFSSNGREVINIVQLAENYALFEGRNKVLPSDIRLVAKAGRYKLRHSAKFPLEKKDNNNYNNI